MSKVMTDGVLSMPSDLFWQDSYLHRVQVDDYRLEAVKELQRLRKAETEYQVKKARMVFKCVRRLEEHQIIIDELKAQNKTLLEALHFIVGTAYTIDDATKIAIKALQGAN